MTFNAFFQEFPVFFAVLGDCDAKALKNWTFVSGENGLGSVNVFMFAFFPNLKKLVKITKISILKMCYVLDEPNRKS